MTPGLAAVCGGLPWYLRVGAAWIPGVTACRQALLSTGWRDAGALATPTRSTCRESTRNSTAAVGESQLADLGP